MNLSPDLLKAQLVRGRMCARRILNRKKSVVSLLSNFSINSRETEGRGESGYGMEKSVTL